MSDPKIKSVSIGSREHVKIERRFDEATGGAPRLIEGAEKATVETDILRHKWKRQREIIEKIIKSAPWSNEKASSFLVLDDMLVTAMRLGALELTNNKRDELEVSRKNRVAAKGRGKQLSAAAAATWQPVALRLAQEAQKEDRTLLAQGKIVDAIFEQWPEDVPCPESQLLAFVRDCQLKGKILSSKQFRTRNGRPAG